MFAIIIIIIIINGDTIREHLAFLQLPCTKLIMDMLNTQSLWSSSSPLYQHAECPEGISVQ